MRGLGARTLDIVLVACAIVTTIAVVRREFFPQQAHDGKEDFKGWRDEFAFARRSGSPNAPYRLILWSDYQCPACRQFEKSLDSVKAQLGDSLTVVYRYYPLPIHQLAFPAAVAAECANEQGAFAPMNKALFAMPLEGEALPVNALLAATHIPDPKVFRSCLNDSTSSAVAAVRADLEHVQSLNLRGTPALQIGDRVATGGLPADELERRLRAAKR